MTTPHSRACLPRGFTLVEVLVAILILALLCLILGSLTSNMQRILRYSLRRMDSDEMAQLALARLSTDIQGMFPRRDIPFSVSTGTSPGPFLGIITAVPTAATSVPGNRMIAAVYYRVANDQDSGAIFRTGHLTLQRAAKTITNTQAGFLGVDTTNTPVLFSGLPAALQPASSDYDVLADGVIAVNVSLQRTSDGHVVAAPATATNSTVLADGDPDISKISALVVTLLVLDRQSFALLNPAQVTTIASKFPPPQESDLLSGKLAAEEWTTIADDSTQFPGLPPPAVQSLRIYQRIIPLAAPSN